MRQVTRGDRLDVDREAVAVVNDHAQFAALAEQRGSPPRFVLLSHDNDGVTKFGPDLLWYPPDWLGPSRPRPEPVAGGSPRGIPPAMRWRPVTTFFQSLVDMKNAQTSGPFRAWPARLPRGPAPLPQRRVRAARVRGAAPPDRGDARGARDRARAAVRRRPRSRRLSGPHILRRGRCATGRTGRVCGHAGEPRTAPRVTAGRQGRLRLDHRPGARRGAREPSAQAGRHGGLAGGHRDRGRARRDLQRGRGDGDEHAAAGHPARRAAHGRGRRRRRVRRGLPGRLLPARRRWACSRSNGPSRSPSGPGSA